MGDILARHVKTGRPVFLEVKAKKTDKLTQAEALFSATFDGHHFVVYTVADAFSAIGLDNPAPPF
jgi:hypothetical protein